MLCPMLGRHTRSIRQLWAGTEEVGLSVSTTRETSVTVTTFPFFRKCKSQNCPTFRLFPTLSARIPTLPFHKNNHLVPTTSALQLGITFRTQNKLALGPNLPSRLRLLLGLLEIPSEKPEPVEDTSLRRFYFCQRHCVRGVQPSAQVFLSIRR